MKKDKTCYLKNKEALWRKVGSGAVIICTDEIYNLNNESALFLWEAINGRITLLGLVNRLREEFDVEQKEAEVDVEEFLITLGKLNLIKGV